MKKVALKPAPAAVLKAASASLAALMLLANLSATGADLYYKAGLKKLAGGVPAEAASDLRQARALNPFYDEYAFALGKIWFDRALAGGAKRDFDQAVYWFDEARRAAPFEQNNYVFLGQTLLFASENYPVYLDRALQVVNNGLKISPRAPGLFYILAAAENRAGQDVKAKSNLESALRLDPNYPEALELLGLVNEKLGLKVEAIRAYEKALSLDGRMAEARARLSALKK